MNGTKLFLDTNAIITLLNGHKALNQLVDKAIWLGTSSVCVIEFLSFPKLSSENAGYFKIFLQRVEIADLSSNVTILEAIAILKKENNLKLPDAVIASQAITHEATLVSNDAHFQKIKTLDLYSFELP